MLRSIVSICLAALAFGTAAFAQGSAVLTGPSAQGPLQAELRVERRLLSLDLVSYSEARERQRRARQGFDEVLARLDQALKGDSVALGTLEGLQTDVDTSRAACRITEDRLSAQIEKLQERLRRIALLEGEAGGHLADTLTGRWRVTILPQNLTAVFDLHLDGTLVTGTYQVAGSTAGSFRGTLAGGRLRLERIDARGGFDSLWEGTVAGGRIAGTWTSNELVTGGPTRGDWTAVRESEPRP
ncbi:MAG: hypothetical protein QOF89_4454 [Acidobacteriota bacterium]|jgi:hypothetical protein|nr:hypothetical protein [Acidobacteriota bacterium]